MQKLTISEVVRGALLLHPQGLTVRELAKLTGYAQDLLIACLRRTYGCYIADFTQASGSRQFNAIWCCVAVPPNATKPLASSFPVEIVDDKEAEEAKRRKARREAAKQERIMQKLANKKIREAAKEKPTQPEHEPLRTTWVSVPSWGQAA
jgi:spore cortex formation protein SpoVR/YcgB (stage V sporulation)